MAISAVISPLWIGIVLSLLLLSGCATAPTAYDPFQDSDFKGPSLEAARSNLEAYLNARVRWGGEIAKVENLRDETLLEIVEHPLDAKGRPYSNGDTSGRFIARFPGFLDPTVYAVGRPITIIGLITATTQGKIGAYPYVYPVVTVEQHRLWRKGGEPDVIYYYPDPFWYYAPFYDPFYYPWPRYYWLPPRKALK
jgi:outer membrane lipoprotein